MGETFFAEMKRYVRFGPEDEAALRELYPVARPHFAAIADEFYERLQSHPGAAKVFEGPSHVARLKETLVLWLGSLLQGPWDEAYYERRARIGRVHVKIELPQRYMFGAMDVIRLSLSRLASDAFGGGGGRVFVILEALDKILDIELAIMLETYGEAFLEKAQRLERLEKTLLERRLAISEARYETIVEQADALVTTCTTDGTLLLFNRKCEDVTGLARRDAVGRRWSEIFAPAERREAVEALCHAVASGERSGPLVLPVPGSHAPTRWVRWLFTPLPSASGAIVCAMGIDVSEEHELQIRTRRAERLASLGTLAAGLAHEIRNPLNAAHLQLTLAQKRLGREEVDLQGAVAASSKAAHEIKRLAGLVEDFLRFARPRPLSISAGDLRQTAEEVVSLLEPDAEASGVSISLDAEPVSLSYDGEQMKQVLHNLVRNAVEAAGSGGRVVVSSRRRDDGTAVLTVADDGPGLTDVEAPIFEPFFTTKEGGTGLGLAIVHRIVTDHGGDVSVTSRPGWTEFTVVLPVSEH